MLLELLDGVDTPGCQFFSMCSLPRSDFNPGYIHPDCQSISTRNLDAPLR